MRGHFISWDCSAGGAGASPGTWRGKFGCLKQSWEMKAASLQPDPLRAPALGHQHGQGWGLGFLFIRGTDKGGRAAKGLSGGSFAAKLVPISCGGTSGRTASPCCCFGVRSRGDKQTPSVEKGWTAAPGRGNLCSAHIQGFLKIGHSTAVCDRNGEPGVAAPLCPESLSPIFPCSAAPWGDGDPAVWISSRDPQTGPGAAPGSWISPFPGTWTHTEGFPDTIPSAGRTDPVEGSQSRNCPKAQLLQG